MLLEKSEKYDMIWLFKKKNMDRSIDLAVQLIRLEQELLQKEAADAAMARQEEVLKSIKFKWSLLNLIQTLIN